MTERDLPQKTDELLAVLAGSGVEHIVVGGVAAIAWGGAAEPSPQTTPTTLRQSA